MEIVQTFSSTWGNAQAKGLLAELMQCHPAIELARNSLQVKDLVAVQQNEEDKVFMYMAAKSIMHGYSQRFNNARSSSN